MKTGSYPSYHGAKGENTIMKRIIMVILVGVLALSLAIPILAAPQKIKLTHWTFMEPDKRYFEKRAQDFNVENPNIQLTVESTNYPYEEMHDKLMVSIMSGSGAPDLCDVEIAKMGLFMKGKVIPFYDVTALINKPEYKGKFFTPKIQAFTYFGKVWGIPQDICIGAMYYNTELFKQVGASVDDIQQWSDFVNIGKKITRDLDGDGVLTARDVVMTTIEINDFHGTLGIAKQMGGGIYDAKLNLLLTSKANVDAMQFCQDMIYKDKIAIITPGGYVHDATFFGYCNEGRTATVMMPSWYLNRFTDSMPDLNGKIAFRPVPRVVPGGKRSYMSGGTATVITKQIDRKKLDIAMKFLEYAKMSYESNVQFWTDVGFDPWRVDVYSDPRVMKPVPFFNNEPIAKYIKELIDNNEVPTDYVGPLYADVLEQFRENIPFRIFKNKEDPSLVLNDALKAVKAKAK
jgi:arabinosaccharide transport system substrate-binding protein